MRIPWCVLLLLGAYSRKHCFRSGSNLNLKAATRASRNVVNKIKWAWHFADPSLQETLASTSSSRPLCKRDVREYRRLMPDGTVVYTTTPGLDAFCRNVRTTVYEAHLAANKRLARQRDFFSNMPVFRKVALRWLKETGFRAVQSDKDGVFVLIHKDVEDRLVSRKISELRRCYHPVSNIAMEVEFRHACAQTNAISKLLKNSGCQHLSRECEQVFRTRGEQGLVSKLTWTIKTHKLQLETRLIHASFQTSLEGYSQLLHRWLGRIVSRADHLCKNTADLLCKLRTKKFNSRCCLSKFDVKEFYMSGEHHDLIASISHLFDPDIRAAAVEMLWLVLSCQFVRRGNDIYRVQVGTGMGQIHSGNLADVAFWQIVEKHIVWSDFNVLCYLRFRDDVLVVTEATCQADIFYELLQKRARPNWKVARACQPVRGKHVGCLCL